MKSALAIVTALMLLCVPAFAQPGDEDGRAHGRRDHRVEVNDDEYKEVLWVGNCRVEREWERDGDYNEERECDHDD
jgi:hypothetical protein